MKCLDFDWQINEFMVYCRSTQLREKSMASYEQALRLFERWCAEELRIFTVDKVTEPVIRKYINDLQERGKYTFYVNDQSKKKNYPERRRDYRKPVSVATINNYIRNLRVFFNWLERDYTIRRNPMRKIRQLKYNRQAKVFLSDEDLKKLLSKMDKCFIPFCNNCIIVCLRDTGRATCQNKHYSQEKYGNFFHSIPPTFFKILFELNCCYIICPSSYLAIKPVGTGIQSVRERAINILDFVFVGAILVGSIKITCSN